MESDTRYPFVLQTSLPSFANSLYTDRILDEEPINDLELHFNTLFMMEAEKGKSNNSKSNLFEPYMDKSYTILDDFQMGQKRWESKNYRYKESSSGNKYCSQQSRTVDNCTKPESCETKIPEKITNLNSRTESFSSSDMSSCSYMTNDFHGSVSDFGSYDKSSLDDWQFIGTNNMNDKALTANKDLWNKKSYGENDIFFNDFTGRLTPESIVDDILTPTSLDKVPLPSLETAFSKHFGKNQERDASIPVNGVTCNNLDLYLTPDESKALCVDNFDSFYYPSNILNNDTNNKLENKKSEISKLFDAIDYNDKTDNFDFNFKVYADEEKVEQAEEKDDTEGLIEDLDTLSYYQDDDDDMIGFEEYYSPGDYQNCDLQEEKEETAESRSNTTGKNRHSDERICFWLKCEMAFPSQATLVEHIERVHVNTYKGDEFICLWSCCMRAARPFNARYKLLIHMRVHSGHKPNKCLHPGCGKAFSRLENLKIHRRSHTGERPYRCQAPRCHKAFSNSSDRAKHQRTHFNARPYACQVDGCSKRYTDPSSLRKHVKNHAVIDAKVSSSQRVVNQGQSAGTIRNNQVTSTTQSQRASRAVAVAVQQKITANRLAQQANATKGDSNRNAKRLNTIPEEIEVTTTKRSKRDNTTFIIPSVKEVPKPINVSNEQQQAGVNSGYVSIEDISISWPGRENEFIHLSEDSRKYLNDCNSSQVDEYLATELNIGYYDESNY